MERLLIKNLIVISDSERASFETSFTKGLNILIGKNKTGKSSIIKSIFHTLGCETYMEDSWKKLINTYILKFKYAKEEYCLVRQDKVYKLYKIDKHGSRYEFLHKSESYNDYSNYIVKNIFKIEAELLTKDGNITTFIPPLLFRFQYIDQDSGWIKLGESFSNVNYITDWRNHSIKFIIGYQDEEYYELKKQVNIIKNDINELKIKEKHFSEIYESISKKISENYNDIDGLEKLKKRADSILVEKSMLERKKLSINESISNIKNEVYEQTLQIKILKNSMEYLDEDYNFAMEQKDEIKCPTCGMIYHNSIEERIELVKDIQSGSELIGSYRNELKILHCMIDEEIEQRKNIIKEINNFNIELKEINSRINISELYKSEGRQEVVDTSKKEIDELLNIISQKELVKIGYESEVKKLESTKRRDKIKEDFKTIYANVLREVSINSEYINLRNFVQRVNNTGSERPRTILSYHIALYLYNLSRGENIYNWLVIDTPNQQGQDDNNLQNIDSLIKMILSKKGQVIIGTERETGFEDKASKIVNLKQHKKCLNPNRYKEHCILLNQLESLITKEKLK